MCHCAHTTAHRHASSFSSYRVSFLITGSTVYGTHIEMSHLWATCRCSKTSLCSYLSFPLDIEHSNTLQYSVPTLFYVRLVFLNVSVWYKNTLPYIVHCTLFFWWSLVQRPGRIYRLVSVGSCLLFFGVGTVRSLCTLGRIDSLRGLSCKHLDWFDMYSGGMWCLLWLTLKYMERWKICVKWRCLTHSWLFCFF